MDFGLIVDLETTGLDASKDKIIEIGIIEFGVDAGMEPIVTRTYGALEDPGEPISPEVARITGIEDRHVKGLAIDWALVREFFARASIVIAHNADFDRGFLVRS